jgi:hypothetical protein
VLTTPHIKKKKACYECYTGPPADSGEHGNETLGSVKGVDFLD